MPPSDVQRDIFDSSNSPTVATEELALETALRLCAEHIPAQWKTRVWTLLQEWNEKHDTKLPKETLAYQHSNALRMATKKAGIVRADDALDEDEREFRLLPSPMSLRDLSALPVPPIRWLVQDLIEFGTMNMLSAAPNNYKSWVVIAIAIAAASGRPLFDHFRTEQCGVLIINEEDHAGLLKSRALLMTQDFGLPIHFHVQKEIKITDDNTVKQLLEHAETLNAGLVIFDSLRSVHLAEENSSTEMQEVMEKFKVFNRGAMTVIFTHHNRKSGGDKRSGGADDSRGSTSINAAVHGHLSIEPKDENGDTILVITQQKLKCAAKVPPFKVKVSTAVNSRLETTSFSLEYLGTSNTGAVAVAQTMRDVVALLRGRTGWSSRKDLSLGKSSEDQTLRDALSSLVKSGTIEEQERAALAASGELPAQKGSRANQKFYRLVDEARLEEELEAERTFEEL